MIPSLLDIMFPDVQPVTFKEKMKEGFRGAWYFLVAGIIAMCLVVLVAVLGNAFLETARYWPPFLSLLTLLGFLRGYGILRIRGRKI